MKPNCLLARAALLAFGRVQRLSSLFALLFSMLALFASLGSARAQNSAADFTVHSQVAAWSPPRFGFNLSENGAGSNIRENALINGGGFGTYDLRMDFYASDNGAADGT